MHTTDQTTFISDTQVPPEKIVLSSTLVKEVIPFDGTYQKRSFTHAQNIFSKEQFEAHRSLYHRYVDKRNEIAKTVRTVSQETSNKTYSEFRALKIAQTYAINGQILHELYFEQCSTEKTTPGTYAQALIKKSFGSLEAFKKELTCCALSARGWALCAYSLDDGLLHTYVLEEHDSIVPILCLPLIVIDTYEHAYFIDYATQITRYLETMWDSIDWNVIERRVETWLKPFIEK